MKQNIQARLVVLLLLFIAAVVPAVNYAEESPVDNNKSSFTRQELEEMLAPVALYPDALLSQLLMASTYPLEVVAAARWSSAHPRLVGDAAVTSVADKNWDASVKSMLAFPALLSEMNNNLDWTERLGDAFLGQQEEVTQTVQSLRQKAYDAGHLKSSDQVTVTRDADFIEVDQVNPETIYVPYYDPLVVYGPWWNPAPPYYWAAWPGYYYPGGYRDGFAWGLGITLGAGFFYGGFDWGHHAVVMHERGYGGSHGWHGEPGNPWRHDSSHRRGVPYHDASLRQQFGRGNAAVEDHRSFRGHESTGSGDMRKDVHRDAKQTPVNKSRGEPVSGNKSRAEPKSHAFEDMRSRESTTHDYSNRGRASHQQMISRPQPQPHQQVTPQPRLHQPSHGSTSSGLKGTGHDK